MSFADLLRVAPDTTPVCTKPRRGKRVDKTSCFGCGAPQTDPLAPPAPR